MEPRKASNYLMLIGLAMLVYALTVKAHAAPLDEAWLNRQYVVRCPLTYTYGVRMTENGIVDCRAANAATAYAVAPEAEGVTLIVTAHAPSNSRGIWVFTQGGENFASYLSATYGWVNTAGSIGPAPTGGVDKTTPLYVAAVGLLISMFAGMFFGLKVFGGTAHSGGDS